MRDILLLGDESGSIGWYNFEKMKNAFKAVAQNVNGGIGDQSTQIAMMSFSRWSRLQFGFDQYETADEVVQGISATIFRGGYRSKIGNALLDANTWMFQQSQGMRSFPGPGDNIDHEILIATDGCRTSLGYYLTSGLRAIKKRGIKLSVLAIYARDPRCQETIRSMVDDPNDLYEVGDWAALDNMNEQVQAGACRP
uniref:VWFA domain-containing protein n=1 Tax=Ciona savignyi TaxID=51511 RepID=H2ZJ91_CIOSA